MVSTLVAPGAALNTPSVLAPEFEGLATCPSCHTQDPSTTNLAVSAGADWQCTRCGSRWDAVRLATVAAYEVWLATRACSTVDPAPHAVKAGDTIPFGKYAGRDVRVDGVEYLIVKEDDVLAVQERSL